MTSGARASRSRSNSTVSGFAAGLSALNAAAIASPIRRRASPSITMNRHGVSRPWSGTRVAMVRSVSISPALGPGSVEEVRRDRAAGLQEGEGFVHVRFMGSEP